MVCEPDLALLLTGPRNGPYPRVRVKSRNEKTVMVPFIPTTDTSIDVSEPFFTVMLVPDSLFTVGSPAPLCSIRVQMLDDPNRR